MKYALVTVVRLGGMLLMLLVLKGFFLPSEDGDATIRLDYVLYAVLYTVAVTQLYRRFPRLLPPGMTVEEVTMSDRKGGGRSPGGPGGGPGDGGGDGGSGGGGDGGGGT